MESFTPPSNNFNNYLPVSTTTAATSELINTYEQPNAANDDYLNPSNVLSIPVVPLSDSTLPCLPANDLQNKDNFNYDNSSFLSSSDFTTGFNNYYPETMPQISNVFDPQTNPCNTIQIEPILDHDISQIDISLNTSNNVQNQNFCQLYIIIIKNVM